MLTKTPLPFEIQDNDEGHKTVPWSCQHCWWSGVRIRMDIHMPNISSSFWFRPYLLTILARVGLRDFTIESLTAYIFFFCLSSKQDGRTRVIKSIIPWVNQKFAMSSKLLDCAMCVSSILLKIEQESDWSICIANYTFHTLSIYFHNSLSLDDRQNGKNVYIYRSICIHSIAYLSVWTSESLEVACLQWKFDFTHTCYVGIKLHSCTL